MSPLLSFSNEIVATRYIEFEVDHQKRMGKVIEQTDCSLLVETLDEHGNPLYWIIAAVLETAVIELGRAACVCEWQAHKFVKP